MLAILDPGPSIFTMYSYFSKWGCYRMVSERNVACRLENPRFGLEIRKTIGTKFYFLLIQIFPNIFLVPFSTIAFKIISSCSRPSSKNLSRKDQWWLTWSTEEDIVLTTTLHSWLVIVSRQSPTLCPWSMAEAGAASVSTQKAAPRRRTPTGVLPVLPLDT